VVGDQSRRSGGHQADAEHATIMVDEGKERRGPSAILENIIELRGVGRAVRASRLRQLPVSGFDAPGRHAL
jgi:hypothetical protein